MPLTAERIKQLSLRSKSQVASRKSQLIKELMKPLKINLAMAKIELLLSILIMNYTPIPDRTKSFAIRIVKACNYLYEQNGVSKILANQLLRSGTSVGANVRESRSAQSDRDFLNKLEIALKEARETEYWLEVLLESELVKPELFKPLLIEANEICKILISSTDKIKKKLKN
jgi:four helix bundle protein